MNESRAPRERTKRPVPFPLRIPRTRNFYTDSPPRKGEPGRPPALLLSAGRTCVRPPAACPLGGPQLLNANAGAGRPGLPNAFFLKKPCFCMRCHCSKPSLPNSSPFHILGTLAPCALNPGIVRDG
jgi:hypothetical protein